VTVEERGVVGGGDAGREGELAEARAVGGLRLLLLLLLLVGVASLVSPR
jgi:hypothetical protein